MSSSSSLSRVEVAAEVRSRSCIRTVLGSWCLVEDSLLAVILVYLVSLTLVGSVERSMRMRKMREGQGATIIRLVLFSPSPSLLVVAVSKIW